MAGFHVVQPRTLHRWPFRRPPVRSGAPAKKRSMGLAAAVGGVRVRPGASWPRARHLPPGNFGASAEPQGETGETGCRTMGLVGKGFVGLRLRPGARPAGHHRFLSSLQLGEPQRCAWCRFGTQSPKQCVDIIGMDLYPMTHDSAPDLGSSCDARGQATNGRVSSHLA